MAVLLMSTVKAIPLEQILVILVGFKVAETSTPHCSAPFIAIMAC